MSEKRIKIEFDVTLAEGSHFEGRKGSVYVTVIDNITTDTLWLEKGYLQNAIALDLEGQYKRKKVFSVSITSIGGTK
jgi:hypothetical protein